MTIRAAGVLACIASSVQAGCASSGARSIGTGAGYSVTLVAADPRAGSDLAEGQSITLTTTVRYDLAATDSGRVVLLLQDDAGRNLVVGRPQASQLVYRGSGQVTLSDTLTVPHGIRQLQVFVLLAPWGFGRVSQRVFIDYPVYRQ